MNNYLNNSNIGCAAILAQWVIAILVAAVIIFIFALPLMWLWNWLMPMLFGLQEINWIQSLGIMFLSSILFRGGSVSFNNK